MNEKGAFYGGLLSLSICGFVVLRVQNAIATGELKFQTKPVSVENCDYFYNATGIANVVDFESDKYAISDGEFNAFAKWLILIILVFFTVICFPYLKLATYGILF